MGSLRRLQDRKTSQVLGGASVSGDIYRITIQGRLESHWGNWFDGMHVRQNENGDTDMIGFVLDQAALHGLLAKVRDLGLILISLHKLGPEG